MTRYSHSVLVDVLANHWPTATSGCHCGWDVLGASHSEHVADMYEQRAETEAVAILRREGPTQ